MSIFSETLQRVTNYFLVYKPQTGYQPILDVSRYQAPIDFEVMFAAGVRLVFLRLSVGNYYTDVEFANFYAAAKIQGFKVGAYHVVKPGQSVLSQWNRIMDSLDGRALNVPLVLDCELTDMQNPTTIATCIDGLVNKHLTVFGEYPPLYTRGEWWNSNTIYKPSFKHCPLFVARYTTLSHPWNDDPETYQPRDWNQYALWQFSADGNGLGSAYGVGSEDVDLSRSSADDLDGTLALLHGETPPPVEDEVKQAKGLLSVLNVRNKPAKLIDVGDIIKGEIVNYYPADTVTFPGQEWLHVRKIDNTVGWAARKHPDFVGISLELL